MSVVGLRIARSTVQGGLAVIVAALVCGATATAGHAAAKDAGPRIVSALDHVQQGAAADMTLGRDGRVWGFDGAYGCGGTPPNPVSGAKCGLFSVKLDGSDYRFYEIPRSVTDERVPGSPPSAETMAAFPSYFSAFFDPAGFLCNCPQDPGFPGRPSGSGFFDLAWGSDGNVWFTTVFFSRLWIGRLSPKTGQITVFRMEDLLQAAGRTDDLTNPPRPDWGSWPVLPAPMEIEAGPDGRLYFTVQDVWASVNKLPAPGNRKRESWVGRFDPKDPLGTLATWGVTGMAGPIIAGPDGNMWFKTFNSYWASANEAGIGRIDTDTGGKTFWPLPATTDMRDECCTAWTSDFIAFDRAGDLWYSQEFIRGIGRFRPRTGEATFFTEGFGAGQGSGGIAVGNDGRIYQVDTTQGDVLQIARDGTVLKRIANPNPSFPGALRKMPDGTLWMADHLRANVQKVVGITARPRGGRHRGPAGGGRDQDGAGGAH